MAIDRRGKIKDFHVANGNAAKDIVTASRWSASPFFRPHV